MKKIISINVNGIRSAYNKGLFSWLNTQEPDIVCIQELKCNIEDLPPELINWNGYYSHFHPAQKKGYSGVAIYAKNKPDNIVIGLNNQEIDSEGRYLQFDYADFSVVSLYLPSGSSGEDKQQKKFRFMDFYQPLLYNKLNSGREYIICGDWNIAHREIDLKNWKGNLKNSGFLPEERQWIGDLIKCGFVDGWRNLYPEEPGYTWWSNRGQAYAKDVGWRIDYQMLTPSIAKTLKHAEIFKQIKFSDHAPLIMKYAF
ncbi:MAG: exodeoxyribonuclease [Pseudomonadota bacterium]|nr:exodeoxyribonuclease [Pseudomonadota bacterium]